MSIHPKTFQQYRESLMVDEPKPVRRALIQVAVVEPNNRLMVENTDRIWAQMQVVKDIPPTDVPEVVVKEAVEAALATLSRFP